MLCSSELSQVPGSQQSLQVSGLAALRVAFRGLVGVKARRRVIMKMPPCGAGARGFSLLKPMFGYTVGSSLGATYNLPAPDVWVVTPRAEEVAI